MEWKSMWYRSSHHGIFVNAIQVFDQNWGMAIFCRRQLLPRSIFMWTLKRTVSLGRGLAACNIGCDFISKFGRPSFHSKVSPKKQWWQVRFLSILSKQSSSIQVISKKNDHLQYPKIKSWLPHGFCGFTMNLQWSPKGHLGTLDRKRRMDQTCSSMEVS